MAQNFIRNNATGKEIDLDFAAGPSRPDVWVDGEQVMRRRQLADGRFLVTKRIAALDGFGRQSSQIVDTIETPDYLNPAKIAEQKYLKGKAELENLRGGGQTKGSWRELESGGKLYQVHTGSGKIRPLEIEGQQLEGKGAEAMRKTMREADATRRYATGMADDLEQSLADIVGVDRAKVGQYLGAGGDAAAAQSAVSPAVGAFDARTWNIMPRTVNIRSAIENLRNKAQMFGLTNLRQSGVAPGSITEREWPKFESTLANLDPALSEDKFIQQLANVYTKIQQARANGQMDYDTLMQQYKGQAAPKLAASAPAPGTLTIGTIQDGYMYIGGDSGQESSWVKVQ